MNTSIYMESIVELKYQVTKVFFLKIFIEYEYYVSIESV